MWSIAIVRVLSTSQRTPHSIQDPSILKHICDVLETKQLHLENVHDSENGSYMMTKTLPRRSFKLVGKEQDCKSPWHVPEGKFCWGYSHSWAWQVITAKVHYELKEEEKKYLDETWIWFGSLYAHENKKKKIDRQAHSRKENDNLSGLLSRYLIWISHHLVRLFLFCAVFI